MEKYYFKGAQITRIMKNKFYIIGYKDKKEVREFIAKKFNLKEFLCTWVKVEEVKVSKGWEYQSLKIS